MDDRRNYASNPPRSQIAKAWYLFSAFAFFIGVDIYGLYTGYINAPLSILFGVAAAIYSGRKEKQILKALPLTTKEIEYKGIHNGDPLLVRVYLTWPVQYDVPNLFTEAAIETKKVLADLIPKDVTIDEIERTIFTWNLGLVQQYGIEVFRVRIIEEELPKTKSEHGDIYV